MSPEASDKAPVTAGNGHSLDVTLSRAIDAMSLLREDLRLEGIQDLANKLDDILVECLALYLDRENAKAEQERQGPDDGPIDPLE